MKNLPIGSPIKIDKTSYFDQQIVAGMKTVFNPLDRAALIYRIGLLNERSSAHWGKMTLGQMLRHCSLFDEMTLGDKTYKQSLIGKLVGKSVLKGTLKNDAPLKKNLPTVKGFKIIATDIDWQIEKNRWVSLINRYEQSPITEYVHPFFGTLKRVELGQLSYKHADHHLRQFNV